MFKIIDAESLLPVKSGFKTKTQALSWAKKNLPDKINPFGVVGIGDRFFIQKYKNS